MDGCDWNPENGVEDGWAGVSAASLTRISDQGPHVDDAVGRGGLEFPRCLTLVAMVPRPTAAAVARPGEELDRRAPGHLVYRPAWLHVTILDVTAALHGQRDADRVRQAVRDVVVATAAFEVTVCGIVVLPSGLVAPAESHDTGIVGLRTALRNATGISPECDRVDQAWVTAVRFRHNDLSGLADIAERYADHRFGSFLVESVQLLDTNRLFDRGHPRLVEEVAFAPPRS